MATRIKWAMATASVLGFAIFAVGCGEGGMATGASASAPTPAPAVVKVADSTPAPAPVAKDPPVVMAATSAPIAPVVAPPATPLKKPTVFLIGDSTVRNGSYDNGATAGQFGWGHILHYYFDTSKITVINDAMGGTSSVSYQESPTLWALVIPKIQSGDYVLMQFGHNDGSASLKGNGDDVQGTKHSFGWYMRQYIEQIQAKKATPIVCSLIPRNRWTNGKVGRNTADYALWAKQAADQDHALFIPLNDLIADQYDKLGMQKVQADLFPPNEAVHPNWAGATLNASMVVEGIKALKDCPLKDYLVKDPKVPEKPDVVPPARGELGPAGGARGGAGGARGGRGAPATTPAAGG